MTAKSLENQKKRQKILLIITLSIILIAVIILYFGFWQKSTPEGEIDVSTQNVSTRVQTAISEKKLERINLDFSFLVDKMLPFLKSHGDLPIEKGETGRDNPFIPYWLEQAE